MKTSTKRIFLGLGSSIGESIKTFASAADFLRKKDIHIIAQSSIFKNPPFGEVAKNEFSNAVWEVTIPSDLPPQQLLDILKECETAHGRDHRRQRWSDRPLDIDILSWGKDTVHNEDLTIPHPGIPHRTFVLQPWSEIVDNNFTIPQYGNIHVLLKKLEQETATPPTNILHS